MATQTVERPAPPVYRGRLPIPEKPRSLAGAGIALVLLGMATLGLAAATTLVTVMVLGVFLCVAAVFQAAHAFGSGKVSSFGLHLLLSALYAVAGVSMIANPLVGAASITLLLGYLFVLSGVFRIVGSAAIRFPRWGWSCLSGAITAALGYYVVANLGAVSLFLLGTIFGVDMIVLGLNLIMLGSSR